MALKKPIGSILSDLGFVTQDQLLVALNRQQALSDEQMLPERENRMRLIAEARFSGKSRQLPFLGEVLVDLGYISEKQLAEALREQSRMLEKYRVLDSGALCAVMDMGAMVTTSLNLANVLTLIMKNANRIAGSEASTLMLVEEMTRDLVFSVPTGPKADRLMDIRIKRGQGVAGWVAENEHPVIIPDVSRDERYFAGIDEIGGHETISILCVPLKSQTRLIGVLEVVNKADGTAFTDEDALLLTIFGTQAATAIENARLHGELRERHDRYRRLQRQRCEAEKFSALGRFSSGIAHDFNNILGAISGYTEMAAFEIDDDHPARPNLDRVLQATGRARDLLAQILVYARRREPASKPLDLKTVIRETLRQLRPSLPPTIDVRLDISRQPCCILGEEAQIRQAIMNLCTNARHAMAAEGGVLTLSLEPLDIDGSSAPRIGDIREGACLKLSVSDTGTGMDATTAARAFDPYFTTRARGSGKGLGLSISQGILKSHGGDLRIRSEPGRGTTCEVFLPAVAEGETPEGVDLADLPGGRGERILLIDDDADLSALGGQVLERLGYRVRALTDPRQALALFEEGREDFDLVVTDASMPGMTGPELARRLSSLKPGLPLILCACPGEAVSRDGAGGIGDVLVKPVGARNLALAVRRFLDRES